MFEKGPLATMKLGSTGMSTRVTGVALLLFGLRLVLRKVILRSWDSTECTYINILSFQSRILPTGYKDTTTKSKPINILFLPIYFSFPSRGTWSNLGLVDWSFANEWSSLYGRGSRTEIRINYRLKEPLT